MEAAHSPETVVNLCQTRRFYNLVDSRLINLHDAAVRTSNLE
jgi:hypothetical protein